MEAETAPTLAALDFLRNEARMLMER
jgi:hypothetical protein